MSFVTLYKKTCVDPKEINFLTVAAKIKTPIPPSVISAFKKKVPAIPGAPFDVYIEWDQSVGKCRLEIKKLVGGDFQHLWDDEAAQENKKNLDAVQTEVNGWMSALDGFRTQLRAEDLARATAITDDLEKRVAGKEIRPGLDLKVARDTLDAVGKINNACALVHQKAQNWWNGGPAHGMAPLLAAKRVRPDRLTQEAIGRFRNLEGLYAHIQQSWKSFNETFAAIPKHAAALVARINTVIAAIRDKQVAMDSWPAKIVESERALSKDIKSIETALQADFAELKYTETLNAATEFANKGNTYTILYRNPNSMQQVIERNAKLLDHSRILGGRIASLGKSWSALPAGLKSDPRINKGLVTLGNVQQDYMKQLAKFQETLNTYTAALKAAKTKAVAAAATAQRARL